MVAAGPIETAFCSRKAWVVEVSVKTFVTALLVPTIKTPPPLDVDEKTVEVKKLFVLLMVAVKIVKLAAVKCMHG